MTHTDRHPSPEPSGSVLPVAVLGGGPVGLAAAAHLESAGARPLLFEAGPSAGTSIREWGHVRLFTPWGFLIDSVARKLLGGTAWQPPPEERLPTGAEFVERYLEPLAAHPDLRPHLRFGRRVVGVSRKGMDKVKSEGRAEAPFEIVVRTSRGETERHLARAVIDASGTWTRPNPIGAGGLLAEGELEHADRIRYSIPDVLAKHRPRYEGRRVLVLGSGHSAFNVIQDLVRLSRSGRGNAGEKTDVLWAIRREDPVLMFGGGERDALPARGNLGARLRALVEDEQVTFLTGFRAEGVRSAHDGRLQVLGEGDRAAGPVDEIIATTGFRPDLDLLRELRIEFDPWLEAPVRLAPLIDPNRHSCGTVYPHGFEELAHPDPDVYVVGMKSYGRAPTFLLLTGYEQVRSVVAALTGDLEAARDVRLTLPATGVCSTDLVAADAPAVISPGSPACCV